MSVDAPSVLIVEDEPAQQEVLAYNLRAEGFVVHQAMDADDAQLLMEEERPDIVVLDWMLPGVSGIELCRRWKARSETKAIPIVMLTARSELDDKVRGLDTGADDYVVKPYSVAELIARLRARLRISRPGAVGNVVENGNIRLDLDAQRAYVEGQEVALGPLEFRLLRGLMERAGRVWTRDQLLDRVWGRETYLETRTVDVHVGRLRKALGAAAADRIRTVRGTGYSLD